GPAPAGQLARDRGRRDGVRLVGRSQHLPPTMESTVPEISPFRDGCGDLGPVTAQDRAGPVRRLVLPCGLDKEAASMGVASAGDPAEHPGLAGGMLRWDQPQERWEVLSGEPGPVPDLDCEPERGQGRDASQAAQTVSDLGELAALGELVDRGVEPVTAGEVRLSGVL